MMKLNLIFAVAVVTFSSRLVYAQTVPPVPPMTNGGALENNGMKHLNVALSDTALSVHVSDSPSSPVIMISGMGVDYTDDKFNVLENVYFNGQYGWLPEGTFDALPADSAVWIKRTGVTSPAGAALHVYEGGNMREGMAAWTMNEIYANDGDIWMWDGAMQHDYYTADLPGDYSMSFEVFVGDQSGTPLTQFAPAAATLDFRVVPEPNSYGWFGLMATAMLLRHRRRRCECSPRS